MQERVAIQLGPLTKASFLERPNRFIVRCRLERTGEVVEAHLADPGRLKELLVPGACLYLRQADNPKRKTKWSVILVEAVESSVLVSLQSTMANHLARQAIESGAISGLKGWFLERAEYTKGNSRWDFLLTNAKGNKLLLEVKSCTLVEDGVAMFPDAVTARGKRHVEELTRLKVNGDFTCAVLFVVQRSDAEIFKPAGHIDPSFAEALKGAVKEGVEVFVYNCRVDETEIAWGAELPIHLS